MFLWRHLHTLGIFRIGNVSFKNICSTSSPSLQSILRAAQDSHVTIVEISNINFEYISTGGPASNVNPDLKKKADPRLFYIEYLHMYNVIWVDISFTTQ